MTKARLIVMLPVVIISSLAVPWSAGPDVSRPSPKVGFVCSGNALASLECGSILCSYKEVEARYNGLNQGSGTPCDGAGSYGLRWECPEYVNRFYALALHISDGIAGGDAITYFTNAVAKSLTVLGSGCSTVPPQPDDILVFDHPHAESGHVAIITSVATDDDICTNPDAHGSVRVIEQNNSATGVGTLTLTCNLQTGAWSLSTYRSLIPIAWERRQALPAAVTWRASPLATSCDDPPGSTGRAWTSPSFDDAGWAPIALPDSHSDASDRFYRGSFELDCAADGRSSEVSLFVKCDDGCDIYIDGGQLGSFGGSCHTFGCVNEPRCGTNTTVSPIVIARTLRYVLGPGLHVIAVPCRMAEVNCSLIQCCFAEALAHVATALLMSIAANNATLPPRQGLRISAIPMCAEVPAQHRLVLAPSRSVSWVSKPLAMTE